ncbi:D-glutamate cyclase family protein [Pseudoalteromonas luteoviolacea]|uniref:DUF1445 domain-containing protein n=1 Tax=Pseudoalteromonas luteoviolacea NCIMB 1942 TaxID=1365253 RepID=A0A166Z4X7_9GAMM|nr:DUF1445 domain-containing protein [Pseudoalteromonas luteoviolacea]KZN43846.1 hypothetical protein N482_18635 [Pseudoalteromonas luteoviolacea NCIMB 1942]KZX01531.1 hypothetical protein JL49_05315 [Pseudoalteromonas luteoviolacea]
MDPKASLTAPNAIREMIRAGDYSGPTNGFVPGFTQCNIVILPKVYAFDFQKYCLQNHDCCPLLATSVTPGDHHLDALGGNIDIRSDIPKYRILRDGQLIDEVNNIHQLWREDFVTFALASYIAFDYVLHSFGFTHSTTSPAHTLPMYISNIPSLPVGPFAGDKVVCLRPMDTQEIIKAIQAGSISRVPHGIPVHFGDPSQIGIRNLSKPNFGEPIFFEEDKQPVFWTTSLTAHLAITRAAPELCIINSPQHMLVTDRPDMDLLIQ